MKRVAFSPVAALLATSLLSLTLPTQSAWACASCGCNLSADWDNPGLVSDSGFKLDIRDDFINQNQLRSGTGTISPSAASQIVNGDNGNQEVEKYTRNNYLTATLDYTVNRDWGVNVQLPYIVRNHSTLGTESDGTTAGAAGPNGGQYDSHTASLGDVKLIGRYTGALPSHQLALLFGLKLATGSHTETGTSTDPNKLGPVDIDRGLQPGTGTTDLILGATYVGSLTPTVNYMLQGLFQSALKASDGYRPGNGVNLNAGLRYTAWSSAQPQLQLNIRHALRDTGENADQVSTGGTLVYLSPGVNVPLNRQAAFYGYIQMPLYQDVNGVQLAPKYTASLGVRYAF